MDLSSTKPQVISNLKFWGIVLKRSITHSQLGASLWAIKGAKSPAPNSVKLKVLKRNFVRFGTCIETGTYLGDTTLSLSKNFPMVISIEPENSLYLFAKKRLRRRPNVHLIFGTSEEKLSQAIKEVPEGGSLNLWLDGHFSGGFTYRGKTIMPLKEELEVVSSNLNKFSEVVIAIDDFRDIPSFSREDVSRERLVEFAQTNFLSWSVEQDIFIMKKKKA